MRVVAIALVVFCPWLCQSAWAAPKSTNVPRFDVAVDRAVTYISSAKIAHREEALAAYALLKAGIATDHAVVAAGIEAAKERADNKSYASLGYDHIYMAGVDAMLLADVAQTGEVGNPDSFREGLQNIATYVESVQQSDGSWSNPPAGPGDISMTQYGLLALWACQRSGCNVRPELIDRTATFLAGTSNSDGGWGYRPGTNKGPGQGRSTHNMTLAAAGSVAITRLLLHGEQAKPKVEEKEKTRFSDSPLGDIIRTAESEQVTSNADAFSQYRPGNSRQQLNGVIASGLAWHQSRFTPAPDQPHRIYFYYALERAAALSDFRDDWHTTYGDGLLTLADEDGSFDTHSGRVVGTSLAILFFVRSTQQILKTYGVGLTQGARNLEEFLNPNKKGKKKREIGALDDLLNSMEGQDFASLDISTDKVVETIQFSSREQLIGERDKLKVLLQSPDASSRQIALWALSRTGDFELIPLMLDSLMDPHLDVNVEALSGLRYISRKPNGFGLPLNPLEGLPASADEDARLKKATQWRLRAAKAWREWYAKVRPYDQRDGSDELALPVQ